LNDAGRADLDAALAHVARVGDIVRYALALL